MTDQAIANLKKKLDALSSKSPKGKATTKQDAIPVPKAVPVQNYNPPVQEKRDILNELSPEDIKRLKAQLGIQEVPQEIEEVEEEEEIEEEPSEPEPSEEDVAQWRKIQDEIARLQNTGAFRVEMLYQYLGMNVNLGRIATALEKLTGVNGRR